MLKNLTLAYMWYQIGATAGFKDSEENRDRIARMMDQDSILIAKKKLRYASNHRMKGASDRTL